MIRWATTFTPTTSSLATQECVSKGFQKDIPYKKSIDDLENLDWRNELVSTSKKKQNPPSRLFDKSLTYKLKKVKNLTQIVASRRKLRSDAIAASRRKLRSDAIAASTGRDESEDSVTTVPIANNAKQRYKAEVLLIQKEIRIRSCMGTKLMDREKQKKISTLRSQHQDKAERFVDRIHDLEMLALMHSPRSDTRKQIHKQIASVRAEYSLSQHLYTVQLQPAETNSMGSTENGSVSKDESLLQPATEPAVSTKDIQNTYSPAVTEGKAFEQPEPSESKPTVRSPIESDNSADTTIPEQHAHKETSDTELEQDVEVSKALVHELEDKSHELSQQVTANAEEMERLTGRNATVDNTVDPEFNKEDEDVGDLTRNAIIETPVIAEDQDTSDPEQQSSVKKTDASPEDAEEQDKSECKEGPNSKSAGRNNEPGVSSVDSSVSRSIAEPLAPGSRILPEKNFGDDAQAKESTKNAVKSKKKVSFAPKLENVSTVGADIDTEDENVSDLAQSAIVKILSGRDVDAEDRSACDLGQKEGVKTDTDPEVVTDEHHEGEFEHGPNAQIEASAEVAVDEQDVSELYEDDDDPIQEPTLPFTSVMVTGRYEQYLKDLCLKSNDNDESKDEEEPVLQQENKATKEMQTDLDNENAPAPIKTWFQDQFMNALGPSNNHNTNQHDSLSDCSSVFVGDLWDVPGVPTDFV